MVKALAKVLISGCLLAIAIAGDCIHPSVLIPHPPPHPSDSAAATDEKPLWETSVIAFADSVQSPRWDWVGYLPSRGLAAAAHVRPSAVIANYEFEHNQSGPELTNLTIALESFDYLVIPAGSEVSFNSITGPRLLSRGYKPGLMYNKGKVITGVGGGVCVASTGIYNAALLAGFPIVERWMHSGPTSYASATRDAAVVYGHKDFRFKNNTSFPVVVRTVVEDDTVRVSFLTQERLPYKIALKEEGAAYIPPALETRALSGEEETGTDDGVIQAGAPGCNRKLVRQFWQGSRMIKSELIARDIREPKPRIVASVGGSSDSKLEPPAELDSPILPSRQGSLKPLPPAESAPLQKTSLENQFAEPVD